MKYLQWKLILIFFVIALVLLSLYQLFALAVQSGNDGNLISLRRGTPPVAFLSYLVLVWSFAVFLTIPVILYQRYCALRVRKLINAAHYWRTGDFSASVQDGARDDIGQLSLHLEEMARELQRWMDMQRETISAHERNILARELHDTVKQQVFALAFQVSIARKIHQKHDDQLAMHLQEAKKLLSDIQGELNNLIVPMRQDAFKDQELADALAAYLSRWSHQYGIFVKFTTEIQGQEKNYFLLSHVKGTFFRVAQEALSNVGRHSKASSVSVTLTIGWLYVTLKIIDNGQGFSYSRRKESGVGLSSMRERMSSIGGDLSITSKALSGTEIVATYCPKDTKPNIAVLKTIKG